MKAVTDAAVGSAAAAIQVRIDRTIGLNDLARAALEAAAPHMFADLLAELRDYQKMLLAQASEAEVFRYHATGLGVAIRLIEEASK